MSFDIFSASASVSSLKCKKLCTKRSSKKEQEIINKLKDMKDKMAKGELILHVEKKKEKEVEWSEIERITA